MSAKDLPWFPFYVDRFMGSRKTRTMDARQVGIYLLLLCEQWDNGSVPDDREEIEDIARAPYDDAMAVLSRCFALLEDGWVNDALEEIRAIQEAKSKAKSRAGKVGAEKRWGKRKKRQPHSSAMPSHSNREEKIREEETTKKEPSVPKKATHFPPGWKPNDSHGTRATECGLDLSEEAAAFEDNHVSKGNTFLDWDRAFFTWMRQAVSFGRGHKPNKNGNGNGVPLEGGGFYVGG